MPEFDVKDMHASEEGTNKDCMFLDTKMKKFKGLIFDEQLNWILDDRRVAEVKTFDFEVPPKIEFLTYLDNFLSHPLNRFHLLFKVNFSIKS